MTSAKKLCFVILVAVLLGEVTIAADDSQRTEASQLKETSTAHSTSPNDGQAQEEPLADTDAQVSAEASDETPITDRPPPTEDTIPQIEVVYDSKGHVRVDKVSKVPVGLSREARKADGKRKGVIGTEIINDVAYLEIRHGKDSDSDETSNQDPNRQEPQQPIVIEEASGSRGAGDIRYSQVPFGSRPNKRVKSSDSSEEIEDYYTEEQDESTTAGNINAESTTTASPTTVRSEDTDNEDEDDDEDDQDEYDDGPEPTSAGKAQQNATALAAGTTTTTEPSTTVAATTPVGIEASDEDSEDGQNDYGDQNEDDEDDADNEDSEQERRPATVPPTQSPTVIRIPISRITTPLVNFAVPTQAPLPERPDDSLTDGLDKEPKPESESPALESPLIVGNRNQSQAEVQRAEGEKPSSAEGERLDGQGVHPPKQSDEASADDDEDYDNDEDDGDDNANEDFDGEPRENGQRDGTKGSTTSRPSADERVETRSEPASSASPSTTSSTVPTTTTEATTSAEVTSVSVLNSTRETVEVVNATEAEPHSPKGELVSKDKIAVFVPTESAVSSTTENAPSTEALPASTTTTAVPSSPSTTTSTEVPSTTEDDSLTKLVTLHPSMFYGLPKTGLFPSSVTAVATTSRPAVTPASTSTTSTSSSAPTTSTTSTTESPFPTVGPAANGGQLASQFLTENDFAIGLEGLFDLRPTTREQPKKTPTPSLPALEVSVPDPNAAETPLDASVAGNAVRAGSQSTTTTVSSIPSLFGEPRDGSSGNTAFEIMQFPWSAPVRPGVAKHLRPLDTEDQATTSSTTSTTESTTEVPYSSTTEGEPPKGKPNLFAKKPTPTLVPTRPPVTGTPKKFNLFGSLTGLSSGANTGKRDRRPELRPLKRVHSSDRWEPSIEPPTGDAQDDGAEAPVEKQPFFGKPIYERRLVLEDLPANARPPPLQFHPPEVLHDFGRPPPRRPQPQPPPPPPPGYYDTQRPSSTRNDFARPPAPPPPPPPPPSNMDDLLHRGTPDTPLNAKSPISLKARTTLMMCAAIIGGAAIFFATLMVVCMRRTKNKRLVRRRAIDKFIHDAASEASSSYGGSHSSYGHRRLLARV